MGLSQSLLSEQDRAKLDGIVQQMEANNEPEENIRFVVEDFKAKYSVKKKEPSPVSSKPAFDFSKNAIIGGDTIPLERKAPLSFKEDDPKLERWVQNERKRIEQEKQQQPVQSSDPLGDLQKNIFAKSNPLTEKSQQLINQRFRTDSKPVQLPADVVAEQGGADLVEMQRQNRELARQHSDLLATVRNGLDMPTQEADKQLNEWLKEKEPDALPAWQLSREHLQAVLPVDPATGKPTLTAQSILNRFDANRKVLTSKAGTFEDWAKNWAKQSGIIDGKDMAYTEKTGGLPPAMQGSLNWQFAQQPAVKEWAAQSPQNKAQYDKFVQNIPTNYPDFGKTLLAQAITDEREKEGLNSRWGNFKWDTKDGKDKNDYVVEQLAKQGKITPQLYQFYQQHKDDIGDRIKTPGLLETFGGTVIHSTENLLNFPLDIAKDMGSGLHLYDKTGETRDAINDKYKETNLTVKDWWGQVSQATGQAAGFMLPLSGLTKVMTVAGVPSKAANAFAMAAATEHAARKSALQMFPGDEMKQAAYTWTVTALNGALGAVTAGKEKAMDGLAAVRSDVQSLAKDAVNKITGSGINEAAKEELKSGFAQIVGKLAKGADATLKHNLEVSLQMGGLTLAQDLADHLYGGRKVTWMDVANDFSQTVKTMFIGNAPFAAMAARSGMEPKIAAQGLWEMTNDPVKYERLIKASGEIDPSLAGSVQERLNNFELARTIKKEILSDEDLAAMPEDKQADYLFQSVSQKVLEEKLKNTTDNILRQKIQQQIDASKAHNEKIALKHTELHPKDYGEEATTNQRLAEISKPEEKFHKEQPTDNESTATRPTEAVSDPVRETETKTNEGTESTTPGSAAGTGPAGTDGRDAVVDGETAQKFTLNRANKDLPQAPEIGYSEIDAEKSGLDFTADEVKSVKVLEYRGRNSKGQKVGTVRIIGETKEGQPYAETFDVFFNDSKYGPAGTEGATTVLEQPINETTDGARPEGHTENVEALQPAAVGENKGGELPAVDIGGQGAKGEADPADFGHFREALLTELENRSTDPLELKVKHPDLPVEQKTILQGIKNIKEGKQTKAAEAVEKAIKAMYDEGTVSYEQGAGKQVNRRGVPVSDMVAWQKALKETTPEQQAQAITNAEHTLSSETLPEGELKKWLEEQSQTDNNKTDNLDDYASNEIEPATNEVGGEPTATPSLSLAAVPANERSAEAGRSPEHLLQEPAETLAAGEQPQPEGSAEGVKKTITTQRAYEGEFRAEVKKELESLGLYREVESHDEARAKAKELVDRVGMEAALDAVRNNDVPGGAGAYIWNEALERLDKQIAAENDPVKVADLIATQAKLIDELSSEALSKGRFNSAFADIYQKSDLGYNAATKIRQWEEQFGEEPTAEMKAKFEDLDLQLQELKKKYAEAEKRAKEAEDKAALQNIQESVEREQKREAKKSATQKAKELADKVRKLKTKPIVFRDADGNEIPIQKMGIGWNEIVEIGAKAIEKTGQLIDGIKAIAERLQEEEWFAGLDERSQKAVLKQVEDFFSNEEGTAGRVKVPKKLIRAAVANGAKDIDSVVRVIKEQLKSEYPNATDREIRDAITEYGKTVNMNKEEIATQIRKIKRIGRIVSALEDIEQKKRPLRSGLQRDKLDAEERALQKQLREAMKDLPVDDETLANQLKTHLDAAKSRIKNQIEDLQREIDTKEKVPKNKRSVETDEELNRLRAQRDRLKADHEKIFGDGRLDAAKKRVETRIKDLERRIKEGDFSRKVNKPVVADTELVKLNAEKLRLQEEYDKEFYKEKLRTRTRGEKVKDTLWESWGITRALQATGEASFVLVQGGIMTTSFLLRNPRALGRAFRNAWNAFKSERRAENWLRTIKSQDWYPVAKEAKLALTEPHAEVTAREEMFFSGWTNIIWNTLGFPAKAFGGDTYRKWVDANPFKAIERASVGYLDTIRIERFLDGVQMLQEQGKNIRDNKQEFKDVADTINTLTGRASLGAAEMIAPQLTKIFFSPRNWASALKTATPYALYHFGKMTPTARKMAIADFGRWVGFTTGMVALAAAYLNNDDDDSTGVELDPRSTDFMKIKVGNVRIDPWAGRQQMAVIQSRLAMDFLGHDAIKKPDGKLMPLGVSHQTPTAMNLLGRLMTNKLAPSAAMMYNYFSTEKKKGENGELIRVDEYGKPYDFGNEIATRLAPIYWEGLADMWKDDKKAFDGFITFYAFFGGGVQVYDNKPKKAGGLR